MRKSKLHARVTLWAVLVFAGGCVHGRPFTNSSADFNHGELHEVAVRAELDPVAEEIANIMRERGALIVKRRDASSGALVLSFRQSSERATGAELVRAAPNRAPTRIKNEYVDYGSLYYVELSSTGMRTRVRALGLPVIDGVTACPAVAQESFRDCQPAPAGDYASYADASLELFGVRVDGARERDHVQGLLAELQLRWPEGREAADPAASAAANEAFAQ